MSLEIMFQSGLDIQSLFNQLLRVGGNEESVLVKTKTAIYLAKLSFEESLKVSSMEESGYARLADQIDTLILIHRDVVRRIRQSASGVRKLEVFHELGELRAHLELIDRRLKTIHVWSDGPRRRSYPTGRFNCWVDAKGYRVRDPALAVNVRDNGFITPAKKTGATCPNAPEKKTRSSRDEEVPLAPAQLFSDDDEDDSDDEDEPMLACFENRKTINRYAREGRRVKETQKSEKREDDNDSDDEDEPMLACFENRKTINRYAREGRSIKPKNPVSPVVSSPATPEQKIPLNKTPQYISFHVTLKSWFAKLQEITNTAALSKTAKLEMQCDVLREIGKYLLSQTEYIKSTPEFCRKIPQGTDSFIGVCVRKSNELAQEIEESYNELRRSTLRSSPSLRELKTSTIQILNEVSDTMQDYIL